MAHDPLDTALREGEALLDKAAAAVPEGPERDHVRHLGQPFALGWGMLRAIYECPDCPGSFRVPLTENGKEILKIPRHQEAIVCPTCRRVWTKL